MQLAVKTVHLGRFLMNFNGGAVLVFLKSVIREYLINIFTPKSLLCEIFTPLNAKPFQLGLRTKTRSAFHRGKFQKLKSCLPSALCSLRYAFIPLLFVLFALPLQAANASQVMLGWVQSAGPDIAGYKVHYGTYSGIYEFTVDVGNYTECSISGLVEGTTYYFAATAYNTQNMESDYSNEVVYSVPLAGQNNDKIWLEAEDGYLQAPMELAPDVDASSGMSIWVPTDQGSVFNPSQDAGYAEYAFVVPQAGNYVIWGRVLALTRGDDSFFISMDGGDFALWDTQQAETYIWDQVNNRGDSDPVVYSLAAGAHALTIKQREDGTKIDRILITNDMGYIP
jgi:hypothetical protein